MTRTLAAGTIVLQEDRELLEAVPPEHRGAAVRASVTPSLRVARGELDVSTLAARVRGGHGLLVLDGLLVRRVGIEDRVTAELLGPGDLLRPLEHDGEQATLPFAATWRVLEPLRLALLDGAWSARMAAFPGVGVELTARVMLRSRRLANMFVITSYPHLEQRLLLLLWELADRYGTVGPDGVRVPIPLTHQVLSELAAARRPSVSGALSRLTKEGALERISDGWLLKGEPSS
jgi:CRP/FNR family transcriptional regulator, cyclic AMP receptor protein